jgi:Mrp family chromosome partitioning ATPase
MAQSFLPQATGVQESTRALQRALASSRSQWGDATRQSFDQRHAEVIVASSRKVADDLAALAQELAAALASLSC